MSKKYVEKNILKILRKKKIGFYRWKNNKGITVGVGVFPFYDIKELCDQKGNEYVINRFVSLWSKSKDDWPRLKKVIKKQDQEKLKERIDKVQI